MPDTKHPTFSVFLCHASEDKPGVRKLYQDLVADGVDAWLDEKEILPGQDWDLEIAGALRAAKAIVICLSKNSTTKEGYVQRELRHALKIAEEKPDGTIFLIPARLEECTVPLRIMNLQYVDLFNPDGYARLLQALKIRAQSLGYSFEERKPARTPVSDNRYELLSMVKSLLRGDDAKEEALVHLANREPEQSGWFHLEIRGELQKIMEDQDRSVAERVRAGDTLSQVGDPRFRPDAWFLSKDDLLGFIEIPAGPFLMGTDSPAQTSGRQWEAPQHPVDLQAFYLNRYPVTVAQYRSFLMETGSHQKQSLNGQGQDNHPVVSVTWHEAIQYCQWLTDKLRTWMGIPGSIAQRLQHSSWVVTLPSEAEWEKAARGMADTRLFPWGSTFDAGRANGAPAAVGRPSTVGCFTGGQSPFGVQEMSGNVWEWTRSIWGTDIEKPQFRYPYQPDQRENLQAPDAAQRVIRGGSCYSPQEDIRCSRRGADFPNARRGHIGFRLAITLLKH